MKRIIESIITGVILIIISKALEIYGQVNIMRSIFDNFIIGLWPMWVGLLAATLYWFIRDYIQLHNFKNNILKLNNDFSELNKWIGIRSYKSDYSDLKGKIKLYIREELEKEKSSQPQNSAD